MWCHMGEREEQNGPFPEERGRSEEVKAVSNRLTWEACLLPGIMFGSLTPMQPQSVLMFVTSISTKGCTDIQESGQIPKAMSISEGHDVTGVRQIQVPYAVMVTSWPNL